MKLNIAIFLLSISSVFQVARADEAHDACYKEYRQNVAATLTENIKNEITRKLRLNLLFRGVSPKGADLHVQVTPTEAMNGEGIKISVKLEPSEGVELISQKKAWLDGVFLDSKRDRLGAPKVRNGHYKCLAQASGMVIIQNRSSNAEVFSVLFDQTALFNSEK